MLKDPTQVALKFLKFRPRSVFEIEQKLKSKKISENEIGKVISVLKKNKLLDDENFAKMWVRDRNLLKPTGSFVLKMELKRKGISDDIIEEVLTPQRDKVLAKNALELKYRDRNIDYEKKVGFLRRRGFSQSVIYEVLKEGN